MYTIDVRLSGDHVSCLAWIGLSKVTVFQEILNICKNWSNAIMRPTKLIIAPVVLLATSCRIIPIDHTC
jgi:hypothetical protein